MGSQSLIDDKHINWKRKSFSIFPVTDAVSAQPATMVDIGNYKVLAFAATNDTAFFAVRVPLDLDPTFKIGVAIRAFTDDTDTAKSGTLVGTCKVVALGSAFDPAVDTAFGTAIPVLTPTATGNALQELRGEIAANTISEQQVRDRVQLNLELIFTMNLTAGKKLFVPEIAFDYVPRATKGTGAEFDISL